MQRYLQFKKPLCCPNSSPTGYNKRFVSIGDFIVYQVHLEDDRESVLTTHVGRVLGLATHDGLQNTYQKNCRPLVVLQADCTLSFGYIVHVPLGNVLHIRKPGPFTFWFLFREMPAVEKVERLMNLGALSNAYIAKYINGDGHGVAPGQDPPVDEELMKFFVEDAM